MIFPERRLKSRSVTDVSSGPGYSLIQTSYVFWFVSLAKIGLGNVVGWVLVVGQQLGSPEQRGCKESEEEKERRGGGGYWFYEPTRYMEVQWSDRVDELGRAGAFVTAKVAMVTLYFSFPSVPTGSSRVSNVYDVYVFT
ncbi:hypothetical protein V1477_017161 [Vespula maculifrons]|uniref:Uncharacterized protein n=1 Tax=Vespula maculifrons TaxID=7453 RepID=A0ABD2B588_VESMC